MGCDTCQAGNTGATFAGMETPTPLTWGPDSPFKYVAGDPGLDLVNTAAWTDRGLLNDRLTDYARLTHWAVGAGLIDRTEGERLRREAASRPGEAAAAWQAARSLRALLQRLFAAVATEAPLDELLQRFNVALREAHSRLQLAAAGPAEWADGRAARWTWHGREERLDALLWPVIRGAAELIGSAEATRIHLCGGDDCGWMYVDRSRNGLRRWCEMETCGTRAKSLRRARRGGRAA